MAIRSLVAVLLVFASAIVAAQQRPVFRAETNYIEISAVVTDKLGTFVSGLTQADFEVREGRARRAITTFSRFDAEAASSPGAPSGRVYLLVVDSPYAQETDKTCRSLTMARQFVEGFV